MMLISNMSFVNTLVNAPGLSLYSILAAWILAIYPHALKGFLIQNKIGYSQLAPRDNIERLVREKVDPAVIEQARRLEAAHKNGHEVFPLWVAAVLAANSVGVDQNLLNTVSLSFLLSRVVYIHIYMNQTTELQGNIRSIVWLIGVSMPLYLLAVAANTARTEI